MASSVRNDQIATMSRVRDFPVPHPGQFSLPLWDENRWERWSCVFAVGILIGGF
jgi:hypothetical protein